MMIEPPIDELASKMENNKYKLTCVMVKRAKEIDKKLGSELDDKDKKAISVAAQEIFDGKITSNK